MTIFKIIQIIKRLSYRQSLVNVCAAIVIIQFALLNSSIAADFSKFYFGANAGYADGENSDKKSASPVKKLTIGYAFNQYFILDISRYGVDHSWTASQFVSSGDFEEKITEDMSVSGVSVSTLLNYPFSSRLSLFMRAGAVSWDIRKDDTFLDIDVGSGLVSGSNSQTNRYSGAGIVFGSGVRYMFGSKQNFELRAEWENANYKFSEVPIGLFSLEQEKQNLTIRTNSFNVGLMYYFDKKNAGINHPVILPGATLSDANVDEDKSLLFTLKLSLAVSTDIPFSLSLISTETKKEIKIPAKAIDISFNKGKTWESLVVREISSFNDEGDLESLVMDGDFNFIFPAGKTASLIRIKTQNESISNTGGSIQLNLKSNSDLIANNTLQAKGVIENTIEKSEVASFEGSDANAPLILAPLTATNEMAASIVEVVADNSEIVANLAESKKEAVEELAVLELKAVVPEVPPKKRVLPMVRPFEEQKATPNELAVSNLIWNDVKAYNAFDDASPILLPGIDLIGTWIDTSSKQLNSDSMYEEAEKAAIKGNAGVAIWGNSLEYEGNMYIESHLSLVDEPVTFDVNLNSLKTLDLSLSIPRTRFAFALKELSYKDINHHKLVTLQETSIYQQQKSNSKVLATVKAGEILESSNTKSEWFRVNSQNGWVHASMVAILPNEVYVQPARINVYSEAGSITEVERPFKAMRVLNVKIDKDATWFQLQLPSLSGWVDSKVLKSKPVLPMTEFLLGMQYFQKQDFDNAIQAIKRFIATADNENENNVALSTAYQMLSLCYMQQVNWIEAAESIDKAISLTKYDPSVYSFKAISLIGAQGSNKQPVQLTGVMKNLEYALYLEPEDLLAKAVISALNKSIETKTAGRGKLELSKSEKGDLNKLFQHFSFAEID